MARIYIACARYSLRCAPVSPVNCHAICNGLGKIEWNCRPGFIPNPNMQSGFPIIGDIHSADVHGTGQCVDLLQGPVPALEDQAIMGWPFRQGSQRLRLCQRIGGNQRPVVVVEIDIFHGHRCSSSTTTAPRLNGRNQRSQAVTVAPIRHRHALARNGSQGGGDVVRQSCDLGLYAHTRTS